MKRPCDTCRRPLAGKKGHGFVSKNGRKVECGSCAFPQKASKPKSSPFDAEVNYGS